MEPEVVLRVGVPCAPLAHLHRAQATDCSAFITACNPLGRLGDPAGNALRQDALREAVSRLGLRAIPGVGQHPRGTWPAEASFLIPGLTRVAAEALGRRFAQNAILWCGPDLIPQLILLR
ncbi:MAG TPA: DUF3293 domain-containing protein [Steroidobacteraceae bacterium]|nr:DUF3293 domain-containing protein [Steroidobacteraceae bacterium]